jgi:crossover junction endodeoxyribonuclease RuvC
LTILGIDPGLAVTGYGLLRNGRHLAHGTISSSPGQPLSERILHITTTLDRHVRKYRPDACAMETLFFKAVGARSVILTAQLRGGLFYLMGRRRIPVTEITPATIKLALTGTGRAAKSQMQYMVGALLGIRDRLPDHAADALAAAYCLAKQGRFRSLHPALVPSRPARRTSSTAIRRLLAGRVRA